VGGAPGQRREREAQVAIHVLPDRRERDVTDLAESPGPRAPVRGRSLQRGGEDAGRRMCSRSCPLGSSRPDPCLPAPHRVEPIRPRRRPAAGRRVARREPINVTVDLNLTVNEVGFLRDGKDGHRVAERAAHKFRDALRDQFDGAEVIAQRRTLPPGGLVDSPQFILCVFPHRKNIAAERPSTRAAVSLSRSVRGRG
jgi:hypothetical protein